ncbi:TIGR03899 family protein [Paraferrimonas sedimenticola]|uniref:TIGR03899 family protein n=1 Tax=Paraferrimonas sedimenticola TaxID=375674 RepID=A0AA37RUY2_9GAMM|nr:TIGR03899 family protein [Paraferrimonas sedimenticola]GLP95648.1 TIGR03899 family protein [Paraferrimonas sedimenticola]
MTHLKESDHQTSARQRASQLARHIGLASGPGYDPAKASLAQRAQQRQHLRDMGYQANLEAIYQQCLQQADSGVIGHELDPDWLHHFLQLAEKVHQPKMQGLWAKILANELANPGAFSIASLTTLTRLTQKDAQTLRKALELSMVVNGDGRLRLLTSWRWPARLSSLFGQDNQVSVRLSQFGLPYSAILRLIELQLLYSSELESGQYAKGSKLTLSNGAQRWIATTRQRHSSFSYFRFSPIAHELAQLMQIQGDSDWQGAFTQTLDNALVFKRS